MPSPEGQRQASSGCTNTVHQYKLTFTRHSVWSYHPFILCFIAHIGWQRRPSGQGCWNCSWMQIHKLGWTAMICCQAGDLSSQSWHHPLRGWSGRNGIKGLAKQYLEKHQWFCCWKCHVFGSYYVAGYLKCVIYSWYWSQWNYQLWIILCEEFWQFTSKILVPWRLVFHTDTKQMHVFQAIFCSLSPANKFRVYI